MPSLTVGMHNILMALEAAGVPRLVYLSADTVDRQRMGFLRRRAIVPLFLSATAADHELDEAMIRQSRLEWVIVRPPMLTNGAQTGRYQAGEALREETLVPRVARADVADFMLRQLQDDRFLRRSPSLAPSGASYDQHPEEAS
jgi:nucleoside-diphosphate-sugar epimerase